MTPPIARAIPSHATTPYASRAVCITGSAGFIGGHLAETLLHAGARVSAIDDFSTGDHAIVAALIEAFPDRFSIVDGSILDPVALDEAMDGCTTVFHQAALASVPRSVKDPARTHEVNDVGTLRVLEAMRRTGARRLVNASSSSVYGDTPELPKHEGMHLDPLSPYAASKAAAEHTIRAWCASFEVDAVSLRYFNVFGPRQRLDGPYAAVIPAFVNAVALNNPPTIYGDGRQSRDFTHVANVVYANLLAGATPKRLAGQAVNIGTGKRITLVALLDTIKRLLNRPDLSPRFEPMREGDVTHSEASIGEAKRVIGYAPVISIDDGLADTIAWLTDPQALDDPLNASR